MAKVEASMEGSRGELAGEGGEAWLGGGCCMGRGRGRHGGYRRGGLVWAAHHVLLLPRLSSAFVHEEEETVGRRIEEREEKEEEKEEREKFVNMEISEKIIDNL
jgi:hypothetical protein